MKTYRIRVKVGRPLAGLTSRNERLVVEPKEYTAFFQSIALGQDPEQKPALRINMANYIEGRTDHQLYVLLDEFQDDLDGFPNVGADSLIEVLGPID
ncbi:hypothetical protein K5M36_16765 [Chromobacterium vaccinii]|nr:hypothetical protein [Chromobacterium vaccinii]